MNTHNGERIDSLELSRKLSDLRKKSGQGQRSVAKEVGVATSALSAFENGQRIPSLEQAVSLADYYGISLDELCGRNKDAVTSGKTRADIMRAMMTLFESGIPLGIEESKAFASELIQINQTVHGSVDVLSVKLRSYWLMEFSMKYKRLLELYASKDIDQEVLDSWKAKRLAVNENQSIEDDLFPWED